MTDPGPPSEGERVDTSDGSVEVGRLTVYDVNRAMGPKERRAACTCLSDSCDEEGEPGCRICQLLDHAEPCPAEEEDE